MTIAFATIIIMCACAIGLVTILIAFEAAHRLHNARTKERLWTCPTCGCDYAVRYAALDKATPRCPIHHARLCENEP